jgi:hypothetical protein
LPPNQHNAPRAQRQQHRQTFLPVIQLFARSQRFDPVKKGDWEEENYPDKYDASKSVVVVHLLAGKPVTRSRCWLLVNSSAGPKPLAATRGSAKIPPFTWAGKWL